MLGKNSMECLSHKRRNLIIKFITFVSIITILTLLSSFYPIFANTIIVIIPSIIVLFYSKPNLFDKLKLIMLLAMRILIVFAALRFFNPQVYVDIVLLMFTVNILEATLTDLLKNNKVYNAVSGFAIVAGVIVLKGAWAYDSPIGNYYIVAGDSQVVTILFIIAYFIWSFIFVTNEYSSSISFFYLALLFVPVIGVIATAELGEYGGLGLWLILTANSLTIGLWIKIAMSKWLEKELYSNKLEKFIKCIQKKSIQKTLMLINLILILTAIIISAENDALGYHLSPFAAPIK